TCSCFLAVGAALCGPWDAALMAPGVSRGMAPYREQRISAAHVVPRIGGARKRPSGRSVQVAWRRGSEFLLHCPGVIDARSTTSGWHRLRASEPCGTGDVLMTMA